MPDKKKIFLAIVGLTGSGKSIAADFFVDKGFSFFRFGQITLDICKEKGISGEAAERQVREELRAKHGMGAYAVLNIPVIEKLFKNNNKVIGDGLYSWSEYKILKEKFADEMTVLAIYASPQTRYRRLENRAAEHGHDDDRRWRSFSREEARARDFAEIENIEKAGPIAMADYTIVNEGTMEEYLSNLEKFYHQLMNESKD